MNCKIPCLIKELIRSANKRTTRKKTSAKIIKNKIFSAYVIKKKRKGNTNIDHSKIFMKRHIIHKAKHDLRPDSKERIPFELQEIGWNLSMMRLNYKLTKRTKTEKYKKCFRTNNTIKFNTTRKKLSELSNIIHSILIWKPERPVSILRLHEELNDKNSKFKKKIEREKCRSQLEKRFF